MEVWLLVAIATLLCLLLAVPTLLRGRAPAEARSRGGVEANRGPGGRRGPRMRRQERREDSDEENDNDERRREEELEDLEEAGIKVPEGKIGKKKMEKLQAKADKKREREEKERQELEEYNKLKAAFTVEDEGCEADEEGSEENRLQKFIAYIQETKVVLLEDLAAHFKMKTQDAIDRVKTLQDSGDLTGVVDDRGKFIYISREELESVAKFIRQQGRVSITDLAANSNKLISLN